MIRWNELNNLHAIQKLEKILARWFGVELLFFNESFKLQGKTLEKDHRFVSHFLKLQTQINYGVDYLSSDVEKVAEQLKAKDSVKSVTFDAYFEGVQGICAKIYHEGELKGFVVAYPFYSELITTPEIEALSKRLVACGASIEDAEFALKGMKRITPEHKDYMVELVELVAEEVVTFHQEISLREDRISELNSELGQKYRYHMLIGRSKKMQQVYKLLDRIAGSESTVLIQGENGTGKELVARAIHYNSPRKDAIFLAQNFSAINDNLLESELFGHVKGSFTGAVKDKRGLFETANGGTLFLDEIGDISLAMQVKLLRVLQEGTFIPVGGTQPKKVDVRIIAATNKNLKELIAKGEFREDLFYRINVINVMLPALRERKEDIPVLVDYFLEKKCAEMGTPTKTLSKKCLEKILDFTWPGNVRQLENEIERVVVLSGEDKVVNEEALSPVVTDTVVTTDAGVPVFKEGGTLQDAVEELEKVILREGLKRTNFNKSKLAEELDISRANLIMKVKKYGLERKRAAGE